MNEKVRQALIVGSDEERLAHARNEWIKLTTSKTFLRNMNIHWLEFSAFIQDLGLPPTLDVRFKKFDQYMYFSKNTCYWEKPCQPIDSSLFLKNIVNIRKSSLEMTKEGTASYLKCPSYLKQ